MIEINEQTTTKVEYPKNCIATSGRWARPLAHLLLFETSGGQPVKGAKYGYSQHRQIHRLRRIL